MGHRSNEFIYILMRIYKYIIVRVVCIHACILQAYFDAPEGNNPVAITMDSMQKGLIWINGNSIGRYWTSLFTPLGRPSQTE